MYKIKIRYSEYIVHHNNKTIRVYDNESQAVKLVTVLNGKIKKKEHLNIMALEQKHQSKGEIKNAK